MRPHWRRCCCSLASADQLDAAGSAAVACNKCRNMQQGQARPQSMMVRTSTLLQKVYQDMSTDHVSASAGCCEITLSHAVHSEPVLPQTVQTDATTARHTSAGSAGLGLVSLHTASQGASAL